MTTTEIKEILGTISKGTTLSIAELQELVKNSTHLSAEDELPYTRTRKTDYPRWKHRLQSVLAEMKKSEMVEHDSVLHEYTF